MDVLASEITGGLTKSRQERDFEYMTDVNKEVLNCHKVCPLTYIVLGM